MTFHYKIRDLLFSFDWSNLHGTKGIDARNLWNPSDLLISSTVKDWGWKEFTIFFQQHLIGCVNTLPSLKKKIYNIPSFWSLLYFFPTVKKVSIILDFPFASKVFREKACQSKNAVSKIPLPFGNGTMVKRRQWTRCRSYYVLVW